MNYAKRTLELIMKRFDAAKHEHEVLMNCFSEMSKTQLNKICLFGAGAVGREVFYFLKKNGIAVDFFCDNDPTKWGHVVVEDIKCLSLDEIRDLKDSLTVIICVGTKNRIYSQLMDIGIREVVSNPLELFNVSSNDLYVLTKEEILVQLEKTFAVLADAISKKVLYFKIYSMLATKEQLESFSYDEIESYPPYFPKGIIYLEEDEIFVDCGAYVGDTLESFLNQEGSNKLRKYICYELDLKNYEILINNLKEIDIPQKVIAYNLGVSEKHAEIHYNPNSAATSVEQTGSEHGTVISIDEHLKNKKITFIKMDIEGSEMSAIKGAQRSIVINKPKCAISIYHKAADLWDIPLYLKNLNPDYRIYLRHHTGSYADTVCYAVI